MSTYLVLKWIHIVSSVLLVGTGLGTAYFFFFANRTGNVAAQAVVARLVVRADWIFTAPTGFIQLATGLAMVQLAGLPLSTPWLAWSLALFALALACWLPVVWLQIRMAALADDALSHGTPLPASYWRYARWWERLGYPAFAAMIVIYWLMVTKPSFGA